MDTILNVSRVCSGYGELPVLQDVDLQVQRGEIVAVVGANGAGKTTLLLTISGHLRAQSGSVTFNGEDVSAQPAHAAVGRGLVMVPESGRLFPFMTVLENLELGAFHDKARAHMKTNLQEVMEYFPILADRRGQLAMLDEPSLGLAPIMIDRVFELVNNLVAKKGLSVLLVEQNVRNALQMCQRGYVIEHGQLLKTGSGQELLHDPDVQRSYMGL